MVNVKGYGKIAALSAATRRTCTPSLASIVPAARASGTGGRK